MKSTIRRSVFETNSSSVHAMTICSREEYDAWERGELFYGYYERMLLSEDQIEDDDFPYPDDYDPYEKNYIGEEEFYMRAREYYDIFMKEYTTKSGDGVVVFGYYGHD